MPYNLRSYKDPKFRNWSVSWIFLLTITVTRTVLFDCANIRTTTQREHLFGRWTTRRSRCMLRHSWCCTVKEHLVIVSGIFAAHVAQTWNIKQLFYLAKLPLGRPVAHSGDRSDLLRLPSVDFGWSFGLFSAMLGDILFAERTALANLWASFLLHSLSHMLVLFFV